MRSRCFNKKDAKFPIYGGRGITVCIRWYKFENFLSDMDEPPIGTCLERKDTNGNYEKSNCCWATQKIQQNNRRNNRRVFWEGRTQTLAQWSDELGINYNTLWKRHTRNATFKAHATRHRHSSVRS